MIHEKAVRNEIWVISSLNVRIQKRVRLKGFNQATAILLPKNVSCQQIFVLVISQNRELRASADRRQLQGEILLETKGLEIWGLTREGAVGSFSNSRHSVEITHIAHKTMDMSLQ